MQARILKPSFAFVEKMQLSASRYIIDARAPCEYKDDHIPGAKNWFVLNDNERAQIGTMYKENKFAAKRKGAAYIAKNIAHHLENAPELQGNEIEKFCVYCARGQKRSASLAHVLGQIGYDVQVLQGGYKQYRQQVQTGLIEYMNKFANRVVMIQGQTGSGKTMLLQQLRQVGAQVLDIEEAAKHFGSILGDSAEHYEMGFKTFEANLYWQLEQVQASPEKGPLFVESESKRIGRFTIPDSIWHPMQHATKYYRLQPDNIDIRVQLLRRMYAHIENDKPLLCKKLVRLMASEKRNFSAEESSNWLTMVQDNQFDNLVRDLMEKHYDRAYKRASIKYHRETESAIILPVTSSSNDEFRRLALQIVQNEKM